MLVLVVHRHYSWVGLLIDSLHWQLTYYLLVLRKALSQKGGLV